MKRRILAICTILSLMVLSVFAAATTHTQAQAAVAITGLHVSGNQIVNSAGQAVRLLGVNRSGAEFACIQGNGIWDGPVDAASVQTMASWKINAVRVPLNEDCWLNINGVAAAYGGSNYQTAIINYVNLLNSNGIIAIVELHWGAPGSTPATAQTPMPDADHSPAFWTSVANTFKSNSSVVFDLFNEPYPDNNSDTTAAWTCWRDGGTCSGVNYTVAGMQTLVTTVRNTGATNVILLGGVQYSNALSQWLTYKPTDPTGNLGASWHVYNFNLCNNSSCWDSKAAPVLQQVPLVTSEIGENDCAHGFIDSLMSWLDAHNSSYLGWTWNTWDCSTGPSLISNYNGTATAFGQGFKDHLAALSNSSTNTPVATFTRTKTPVVTPSRTNTPTRTATVGGPTATKTNTPFAVTPSRTPTAVATTSGGACSPVTSTITSPFTFDGAGTLCWQASTLGTYINSWNTVSVSVNGTSYNNVYATVASLPAKIGGFWYISYNSSVAWGHFEAK